MGYIKNDVWDVSQPQQLITIRQLSATIVRVQMYASRFNTKCI